MRELFAYETYSVPLEARRDVVNICLNYGLEIYHERETDTQFSFRMALGDRETAETALSRAGISFSRGELRGVLGVLKRLAHHPGLLAGLVLSVALYLFLTGMVWEVRILSETDVDEDVILEELAEVGLCEGAWIRNLDPDELVSAFLLEDEHIAFASVHFWGTVAEVELISRDEGAEPEQVLAPCNIVASRDAIVTDMTVFTGKQVVKVGQTVAAGDLLVSGVITDVGGTRLLPAAATVMGQVEDTLTIEVPLTVPTTYIVSTHPVSFSLTVFGHTLTLGNPDGASYHSGHRLYLADAIRLPVTCSIGMSYETDEGTATRSEEEAERLAMAELKQRLETLLAEGVLISCETEATVEGGVLTLNARVIYETNIAKSLAFQAETQ